VTVPVPGPLRCRSESCGALVDFALPPAGERGGRVPVDHGSAGDPAGNLAVWRDGYGILRYRYLAKGEEPAARQKRGVPHFATCPEQDVWRKKKP
jgi:hypothetical protein